jgi:hypothetical protein
VSEWNAIAEQGGRIVLPRQVFGRRTVQVCQLMVSLNSNNQTQLIDSNYFCKQCDCKTLHWKVGNQFCIPLEIYLAEAPEVVTMDADVSLPTRGHATNAGIRQCNTSASGTPR